MPWHRLAEAERWRNSGTTAAQRLGAAEQDEWAELGLLAAPAGWRGAGGATVVFKEGCRGSWASVLGVDAVVIAAAICARERRIAQRTGVIRTRVELLEG